MPFVRALAGSRMALGRTGRLRAVAGCSSLPGPEVRVLRPWLLPGDHA